MDVLGGSMYHSCTGFWKTLTFTEDLGDVVVTVTDASGKTVSQETVTTGNMPTWTVILDESVQNGTVSITDGINLVYGEIIF